MIDPQQIAAAVGLYWNGVWQVDEVKFRKAITVAYQCGWDDNEDEQ